MSHVQKTGPLSASKLRANIGITVCLPSKEGYAKLVIEPQKWYHYLFTGESRYTLYRIAVFGYGVNMVRNNMRKTSLISDFGISTNY